MTHTGEIYTIVLLMLGENRPTILEKKDIFLVKLGEVGIKCFLNAVVSDHNVPDSLSVCLSVCLSSSFLSLPVFCLSVFLCLPLSSLYLPLFCLSFSVLLPLSLSLCLFSACLSVSPSFPGCLTGSEIVDLTSSQCRVGPIPDSGSCDCFCHSAE